MKKELSYEQHKKRIYDPALASLKQEVGNAKVTEEIVYSIYKNDWVKAFKATNQEKMFVVFADLHTSELPTC